MSILKLKSVSTWVVFALLSWFAQSSSAQLSSAQSAGLNPTAPTVSATPPLLLDGSSVWAKVPESRDYSLEGIKNASLYSATSRVNNLSVGISQSEVFKRTGRASLTLYAPTPAVNQSLFLANSVSDSRIDGVWVSIIQALSAVVNRQVNTEFTYSMPVNKSSKLDSAVNYRLSPIDDSGRPGLAASLQYYGKF